MKVYILLQSIDYAGSEVANVYKDRIVAELVARDLNKLCGSYEFYVIEEYEVIE